ncbi:MAG: branched-chain amino acid ABC transporter permease [Deltaproteobacteria bacterium]|nr:branched-chain amino acid ABC transporter permease [Deltaproteobacteria bacterium]
MPRKNLLKYIFIPFWFGFLVFPFTGIKSVIFLSLAIFAGELVFFSLTNLKASIRIKETLKLIFRPPILQLFGKKGGGGLSAGLLKGRNRILASIGFVALLVILPVFLNNYYIDVLTLAGLYAVLALGLNISVGMAGLLDLGYIAFYAIGAYTYALLSTKLGVSFWLALPIGGLFAAGIGFMLGIITLRLRGDYLAIVTLGFIQIVHLILNNWDGLTGGPNGILGITRPSLASFKFSQPIHFYYLILGIAILTAIIINRLNNSRIGRAWIAMREDEIAAEAMGIDTTKMKCLAFSIGAFWAGVAGVFFAGKFAFVSPESFTFFESVFVLAMVVLGGMGSILGAVVGAIILIILPEVLRGFASYRMLIFGAVLVAMMLFRPQGLIGSQRRKVELHPEDEKIYVQEMGSLYEVEHR